MKLVAGVLVALLWVGSAWGATIPAASCSTTHVNAAIASASDGDTVTVPAGTCALTGNITVTKNIHLQGAGIDTTNFSGYPIVVSAVASGNYYPMVSAFTYNAASGGAIRIASNTKKFRVTGTKCLMATGQRCVYAGLADYPWKPAGVIDSNQWIATGSVVGTGINVYGDNVFASYVWGSSDAVFIEDNTMSAETSADGTGWVDEDYDGNMVVRYNTITNGGSIGTHGPGDGDPSTRDGALGFEVYGNNFTITAGSHYWVTQLRGGVGAFFNNSTTTTIAISGAPYRTINYRTAASSLVSGEWGCDLDSLSADGNHPYDGNRVWLSGTSGTGGSTTIMNASGLTASAWVGYRLYHGTDGVNSCLISANTTTTVTCTAAMEGGVNWSAATAYQIRTGWPSYMQFGAMKGTTYGVAPRQQDSVPAYLWNNTCSGSFASGSCVGGKPIVQGYGIHASCRVQAIDIQRNRDFFESYTNGEQTAQGVPFDGSFTLGSGAGVGYGTKAFMPATCTTGAGYWVTDEGYWNSKQAGADGVLYKCITTDNWTPYYIPYPYPHPLRSGLAAPTGVTGSEGVACNNSRDAYGKGTYLSFLDATHKWVAGAFVAGGYGSTWTGTKTFCKIVVYLEKTGTPTGTLTAGIYTDNAGVPGTLVGTASTNVVNYSDVGTDTQVTFTGLSASLTAGTTYHVVVWGSANGSVGNTIAVNASGFNEGSPHTSDYGNTGVGWSTFTGSRTLAFTLYSSD